MKLKNKSALITGAAQDRPRVRGGVRTRGRRRDAADRDEARGREAAERISNPGAGLRRLRCLEGVRCKPPWTTVKAFGRIDILVANAGIVHACEFLDLKEEDFQRVLDVNLKGVFLAGQAAARQMVKQGGGGAIINMSSVNAVMAIPNQVPYVVSKGAINQLTKVMALSLAPHAIRVNGIGPGTILTELAKTAVLGNREAERKILSRTPLGRMGDPSEIASVAAFLASDEASYLTGQTIYPDGGRLALNYTVPVSE